MLRIRHLIRQMRGAFDTFPSRGRLKVDVPSKSNIINSFHCSAAFLSTAQLTERLPLEGKLSSAVLGSD